jgi:hypothetical protein
VDPEIEPNVKLYFQSYGDVKWVEKSTVLMLFQTSNDFVESKGYISKYSEDFLNLLRFLFE